MVGWIWPALATVLIMAFAVSRCPAPPRDGLTPENSAQYHVAALISAVIVLAAALVCSLLWLSWCLL